MAEREQLLSEFVTWSGAHITGDEKGQAQIFLDRLFRAFGQKGSLDVGGTAEMRVRKASEDGGGTSFADYVWKPVVLIEMKKRGADLSKHYRQAFDYWVRLVPGRPQYVVLCNFDEFWVYDFNNQLDSPKDKVKLAELPSRWGPLAFLFPTKEAPTFGNDREAVTREAADKLAECFKKLVSRRVERPLAQRFILQTLVALFAEDIGLLPRYLFAGLLDECKQPRDSYDLLGSLFDAMNEPESPKGGRYKGVRYFNGGIFAEAARVELYDDELNQLKGATRSDWSKVSPEIFGAIFQDSMEAEERHAFGAHYTSPVDIMKIVKPTIADPWSAAIESADNGTRLNRLLKRLAELRVLDPACGSGNFLYLAYREMKRLETRIRERLVTEFPKVQSQIYHVNARQFFGLDINAFAIELAKVSMMIGRKLAIEELHIADEADLPLDNLDANFRAGDALLDQSGNPAPWPAADVIIGNPPFLGSKDVKREHGETYTTRLAKAFRDTPGMADYCVHWIRRTRDHLPMCTPEDAFAGRAGLVGTQNISNNKSRIGGLDHVVADGTIVEAVDNQPWSGDANVHVSIVNWARTKESKLVPSKKKLWYVVARDGPVRRRPKGAPKLSKTYQLAFRELAHIPASLTHKTDITRAIRLRCNLEPARCFQGITPGHKAFVLSKEERSQLVAKDAASAKVIHPYLVGDDVLGHLGTTKRMLIDFGEMSIVAAQAHPKAFARIQSEVLPWLKKKIAEEPESEAATSGHINRWWQHWRGRPELHEAIARGGSRYVVCSRITKRPIFVFVSRAILPGDALQTFIFDDDYSFGVLQSAPHAEWFSERCSNMKSDPRYTSESVFETFPWPQFPSSQHVHEVAAAAVALRRVRTEVLKVTSGGLRAVYRTLEIPGNHPLKDAHAALNAAVLAAYGFDPKGDLLDQLLRLNLDIAARIVGKQPVTSPGVPSSYGNSSRLITEDCIRP